MVMDKKFLWIIAAGMMAICAARCVSTVQKDQKIEAVPYNIRDSLINNYGSAQNRADLYELKSIGQMLHKCNPTDVDNFDHLDQVRRDIRGKVNQALDSIMVARGM